MYAFVCIHVFDNSQYGNWNAHDFDSNRPQRDITITERIIVLDYRRNMHTTCETKPYTIIRNGRTSDASDSDYDAMLGEERGRLSHSLRQFRTLEQHVAYESESSVNTILEFSHKHATSADYV